MRILAIGLMLALIGAGATACDDDKSDPGPLVAEGWILRCESRCEQMEKCEPDQFTWEFGNPSLCNDRCETSLTGIDATAFIDEAPDECLEALYADVKCIFALGCSKLSEWKDATAADTDYPCASKDQAASMACEGIYTDDFLDAVGYPLKPDYAF